MGSMAVERMQVEGPATQALPGTPGEARVQGVPLSIDLQKYFRERLDDAVSSATGNAPTPASNLKPPELISTVSGLKIVGSPVKKPQVPTALLLTPDSTAAKQEGTLEVQEIKVPILDAAGKQPVPEDRKDEINTRVTAPSDESCEAIRIEPPAELVLTHAPSIEGSKPVKPEPSVHAAGMKKVDSKKDEQGEKNDVVAGASSSSCDNDLHLSGQNVEPPANLVALSAGVPIEDQFVQLKKSLGTANTVRKRETVGSLPATPSSTPTAGAPQNLQVREAASSEDFKSQFHSEATDKSAAANGGAGTIKASEVPVSGTANLTVPHGTAIVGMQSPSLPVFSGFARDVTTDGLAHLERGAGQVSLQDGFGGDGLRATAAHESSRPDESSMTATANTLEIGLAHGTHGWLKVRAEMENGTVTASLSSGTAGGREMLHRELPALTDFLHQEKLGVSALVVKEASLPPSDSSADGGGGAHRQDSPSQQRSEQRERSSENDARQPVDVDRTQETRTALASESLFLPTAAGTKGGWLNVRV